MDLFWRILVLFLALYAVECIGLFGAIFARLYILEKKRGFNAYDCYLEHSEELLVQMIEIIDAGCSIPILGNIADALTLPMKLPAMLRAWKQFETQIKKKECL